MDISESKRCYNGIPFFMLAYFQICISVTSNGTMYHVTVTGAVWSNPLIFFNSLVIWNNPFGVDVWLTEKPGLHKQKLKTIPEGNL